MRSTLEKETTLINSLQLRVHLPPTLFRLLDLGLESCNLGFVSGLMSSLVFRLVIPLGFREGKGADRRSFWPRENRLEGAMKETR